MKRTLRRVLIAAVSWLNATPAALIAAVTAPALHTDPGCTPLGSQR